VLRLNNGRGYANYGYWNETNGLAAVKDMETGKILIPNGSLSKVHPAFQPFASRYLEAGQRGLPDTFLKPNRLDFTPRAGFAYRLRDNFVLRGAFGIYNVDNNVSEYRGQVNVAPFIRRANLTRSLLLSQNVNVNSVYTFQNPAADPSTAGPVTGRAPAGLVLVDKPAGPSSFGVVADLRRHYGVKAGHAGTLDPLATGLLLVLLGRGTRLARYLVGLDKRYGTEIRLGLRTSTGDGEGEVVEETPIATEAEILALEGEVELQVPAASAVKIDGERAYDLARDGEVVVLEPRPVVIERLALVEQPDEATSDPVGLNATVAPVPPPAICVSDLAPGGDGLLAAVAAGCDLVLLGEWTPSLDAGLAAAAARWEAGGEAVPPMARGEAARRRNESLLVLGHGAVASCLGGVRRERR